MAADTYIFVIDHTKIDETLIDFPLTVPLADEGLFSTLGENKLKFKIEALGPGAIATKSIVVDIADNWGYSTWIVIRSIELYDEFDDLIELTGADFSAYSTTYYSATYLPDFAFTTALSKTGAIQNTSFLTSTNAVTSQRLICVLNTSKNVSKVVINNGHSVGGYLTSGAKNVKMYISTDEITSTVYDETITNSELIFDGQIAQHVDGDVVDDQTLTLQNIPLSHIQCPVEIESWDSANNKAFIHIKVPIISPTEDTVLTLTCLGSPNTAYVGETGSDAAKAVWDENFAAVYHMAQDPSTGGACILDSTSNENHGTPNGSMTSDDLIDGDYGKALEFDGIDDYIDCGSDTSLLIMDDLSIEFTLKWDGLGDAHFVPIGQPSIYRTWVGSDGGWDFADQAASLGTIEATGILDGATHNCFLTYSGDTLNFYVDGALLGSMSRTRVATSADLPFYIGFSGVGAYGTGIVKNIGISNIARSAARVKATNLSNINELLYPAFDITATTPFLNLIIDYNKIDEDLTDFPVMVYLSSDSYLGNILTNAMLR